MSARLQLDTESTPSHLQSPRNRVCNTHAANGYSFCAVIWICNTGVCRTDDFLGIANGCVCVGNTCNTATGQCQ